MTAVLYRSTDAGAPVVGQNGFDTKDPLGKLREAFIAILITGYGDRTPVGGWTVAFDDPANNTIVFRQKDGEVFFRLNDNFFTSTASIRGYTSMTDVNTGKGAFPTLEDNPEPGCSMPKRWNNASSPSGDNWDCIVDSDGQYIWWFANELNDIDDNSAYFFGKLDSFYDQPNQLPIWLNTVQIAPPSFAFSFQGFIFMANSSISQTFGASNGRIGAGPLSARIPATTFPLNIASTGQIGDAKFLVKWYVSDSGNNIIGSFPKLFRTIQQPVGSIGINSSENRTIVTINGQDYYLLFFINAYYFFACDVTTG